MISNSKDTIVAPATVPGDGGVGIIRLSGPQSESCLQRMFRPAGAVASFDSHRFYYGHILNIDNKIIDEVLAVVMRAPRSYTREDVVEIHCHGGFQMTRRIMDRCLEAGARLAQAGEFTFRAFVNGRLDLSEAEAVIDIIKSRSDSACALAVSQLQGKLSKLLYEFRDSAADLLALVEAYIDFPEEDIALPDYQRLFDSSSQLIIRMDELLATFDSGRILKEGISVVILGCPNAGKSSLLNQLLGEARAIVTDIPGTTRDTIEENLVIGHIPVRLVDTAGVRTTDDPIEAQGVQRAFDKVPTADLVLLVVDGQMGVTEDDLLTLEQCKDKRLLVVVNKVDLGTPRGMDPVKNLPQVFISAKTGEGLNLISDKIVDMLGSGSVSDISENVVLSERRHKEAVLRASESFKKFQDALKAQLSPEFLAMDLRDGIEALGEITGETTPDNILNRIFERFCIGK